MPLRCRRVHCGPNLRRRRTRDKSHTLLSSLGTFRGRLPCNRPVLANSIVIYLRPDAGRTDPGYYLQERHGFRVLVQYKAIRLIEIDGQRILDAGIRACSRLRR